MSHPAHRAVGHSTSDDAPREGPLASPGFWLLQAAQRWKVEFNRAATHLDLTHTQFQVLAGIGWLEHLGTHPSQQDVSDQAGTDRMMTSKILTVLEQRQLVQRSSRGRTKQVTLTATGRQLTAQATAIARGIDQHLFSAPAATRDTLQAIAQQTPHPDRRG